MLRSRPASTVLSYQQPSSISYNRAKPEPSYAEGITALGGRGNRTNNVRANKDSM
jgi:hypothetical protein